MCIFIIYLFMTHRIHDFYSSRDNGVTINNILNVTGTSQLNALNVIGKSDITGPLQLNANLGVGLGNNHFRYSEDLDRWRDNLWGGGFNASISTDYDVISPSGKLNANTITVLNNIFDGLAFYFFLSQDHGIYDLENKYYTFFFWAKTISTTNSNPELTIKIDSTYFYQTLTTEWKRYSFVYENYGTMQLEIHVNSTKNWSIGDTFSIWGFQICSGNLDLAPYVKTNYYPMITPVQGTFLTGDLSVDATTLYVDSINGRVGIGTNEPERNLHLYTNTSTPPSLLLERDSFGGGDIGYIRFEKQGVLQTILYGSDGKTVLGNISSSSNSGVIFNTGTSGFGSEKMRINGNGNVGIGTSSPTYKLDLLGDNLAMLKIKTTDTQAGPHIDLYDLNNNVATIAWIGDGTAGTGARDSALEIRNTGRMNFTTSNNVDDPELTILNNGNVGIGTTNPSNKLYVVGDMVVLNNADLNTAYIMAGSGASNRRSNLSFYSTFYNNGDTGTRRTADIVAGFSSGAWGNEYLSFSVGKGGSPNDGQELTNEVMRITNKVGIGTTNPEFKLHVNISNSTNALGVFCTGNSLNPRHQFASSTTQFAVPSCHQIHIRQYQSYERTRKTGLWLGVYSDENAEVSHQTICFTQYLQFQRTASVNDYGGTLEYVSNTTQGRVNGNNTTKLGYIDQYSGNNRLNFTGQHRCKVEDPIIDIELYEGLIVCANKNKYLKMSDGVNVGLKAITINESLPLVSLSNKEKDKSCFGVISSEEDPEKREDKFGCFVSQHEKEKGDMRVYINSLGEGGIWVSNINGPLESGDYITTSKLPGYGQKQDSEFLANYTVAKITMDCDFEPKMQPVQEILKEIQEKKLWYRIIDLEVEKKEYDESDKEKYEQEGKYYIKKKIYSEIETDVYNLYDVIKEYNNILSDKGELQWIDTEEMEPEYKIRYLDENGEITTEENCVYKAAFVGCTYHCG